MDSKQTTGISSGNCVVLMWHGTEWSLPLNHKIENFVPPDSLLTDIHASIVYVYACRCLALEPVLSWLLIYWLWPTRALATSIRFLCCLTRPIGRNMSPIALVSFYSPQMLSPSHLSVSGQSITLVGWLSSVNSNYHSIWGQLFEVN